MHPNELPQLRENIHSALRCLQTLLESGDLKTILHQVFDGNRQDDALKKVLDVLVQVEDVPPELLPKRTLADTITLVLNQIDKEKMIPQRNADAVELVGWLDLAMDDAEVIIVTGMNDGNVPAFQTSDMFLPDSMRKDLALEDNRRRFARDAYALSCILATRQYDPVRTQFIGSRYSVEGTPQLPSRLFFAADDETVTKRVQKIFTEKSEPEIKISFGNKTEKPAVTFDVPKVPENIGQTIKRMSVTDFAEYKKCPYRFYLSRILKLQNLNDEEEEMSVMTFGTLIHNVLEAFGRNEEVKNSVSPEVIRRFLAEEFCRLIEERYGKNPRSVLLIQRERALKRLEAFAERQANWAGSHEIVGTEVYFGGDPNPFILDVDGAPMFLYGKIDRIDRNKSTGSLIIFDYKTGDKYPKDHRKKGEWIDFQLPLYYHLLSMHDSYKKDLANGYKLGIFALPADVDKTGVRLADDLKNKDVWTHQDVLEAIESARDVVRCIWDNKFEKVDPPPRYSEVFAAICNDF